MPIELQALARVAATVCTVALVPFLGACENAGRASLSSRCDYIIVDAQGTPILVFLGLCKERVGAIPDLRPLVADAPPATELLKKIQNSVSEGKIGPLAVFVATATPSTERTKDGPSFCILRQEDVHLLVLRAAGCPGDAENRKILEAASRLTHELSWALLHSTGETRFRGALLRELEDSGVDAEDVRLLNYNLGEPVP